MSVAYKKKFIGRVFDSGILRDNEYEYIFKLISRLNPNPHFTYRTKDILFNLRDLDDNGTEAILDYLRSIYTILDPVIK